MESTHRTPDHESGQVVSYVQELTLVETNLGDESQVVSLIDAYKPFAEQLEKAAEVVYSIKVESIEDTEAMERAKQTRKAVRKIRTTADAKRKELGKEALEKKRLIDSFGKIIIEGAKEFEKYLEGQEKYAERLLAEQKAKLKAQREDELSLYLEPTVPVETFKVEDMTEPAYQGLLSSMKAAHEARQKAEKEAKELAKLKAKQEKEEKARIERERKELEELKAKNEQLEKEVVNVEANAEEEERARREERLLERIQLVETFMIEGDKLEDLIGSQGELSSMDSPAFNKMIKELTTRKGKHAELMEKKRQLARRLQETNVERILGRKPTMILGMMSELSAKEVLEWTVALDTAEQAHRQPENPAPALTVISAEYDVKDQNLATTIDAVVESLCDPENQPHPFVGRGDLLKQVILSWIHEEPGQEAQIWDPAEWVKGIDALNEGEA